MKNGWQSNFFMAASGILVAVLLVWAQLWITTAQEYKKSLKCKNSTITAGIGLTYTYMAIFAAVLAFGITVIDYAINQTALVFFMWSSILTFWLVIGSVVPAFIKTLFNWDLLMPSPRSIAIYSNLCIRILFLVILPGIFLFLSCLYAKELFSGLTGIII